MSSPKATAQKPAPTKAAKPAAKAGKPKAPAAVAKSAGKPAARAAKAPPPPAENVEASASALALAKVIEAGLRNGNGDIISIEAQQALNAALVKLFGGNAEAGHNYPVLRKNSVASTDVMLACAALLKSADLQVFELGMWQSWTGR
jgi:hypothetical protein